MNWLQIALVSYFILSIATLVDKIFLSKVVAASFVYMLWVVMLSIVIAGGFAVVVLVSQSAGVWPTTVAGSFTLMSSWYMFIAIVVGIFFTAALYFLYSSIQKGEISRITPIIGGSMPLLIYAMTFYHQPLDAGKLIAFLILVTGTVLISYMPRRSGDKKGGGYFLALGASFSFAVFFVLTQYLFREQGFINGIIWPRAGSLLVVIAFLSVPGIRRQFVESITSVSRSVRLAWLGNQGLAVTGFVGQAFAISLPGVSVALVAALQSVQYALILIYASLLSIFQPRLMKEYLSTKVIIQKVLSLVLIGIGLYIVTQ